MYINALVIIIIIIIIIIINCNCVVARWQWLFYMYTKREILITSVLHVSAVKQPS